MFKNQQLYASEYAYISNSNNIETHLTNEPTTNKQKGTFCMHKAFILCRGKKNF